MRCEERVDIEHQRTSHLGWRNHQKEKPKKRFPMYSGLIRPLAGTPEPKKGNEEDYLRYGDENQR